MYTFVNDLVPNREKLLAYNIGRLNSANCGKCGEIDSNRHRIKLCPKAKKVWDWCSQVMQSRYKLKFHGIEDILQFDLQPTSKIHKAA